MHTPIDPTVDYAFKRLLGSPENSNLLVHFLNAVLRPEVPIASVTLLNPFNEREYAADKLSVVDVKATDQVGRIFQVEVQIAKFAALIQRIVYTWADVYQQQLGHGEDYSALQPVASIWLLDDVLLDDAPAFHHRFRLVDVAHGVRLSDHLDIHLLELPKWREDDDALDDEDRWVYFFKEAGQWTELPPRMNTPEMRQAMGTLNRIAALGEDYWAYVSRREALREQRTRQREWEETHAALEVAQGKLEETQAELERVKIEAQQAEAELQRVEAERQQAEAELQKAEAERQRAEAERQLAEAERQQADADRQQAEADRHQTEARLARARAALEAAGLDPDAVLK
ncbi:MAG: Rpn family recombination-promoting nuclease/putative transposase [Alphaproteobacteria bacterium]|nr:Rpn family recombination-promoting nuclease/putative transposase [Alphaproteobacteria bacterium]